jgi:hypothetical protein
LFCNHNFGVVFEGRVLWVGHDQLESIALPNKNAPERDCARGVGGKVKLPDKTPADQASKTNQTGSQKTQRTRFRSYHLSDNSSFRIRRDVGD